MNTVTLAKSLNSLSMQVHEWLLATINVNIDYQTIGTVIIFTCIGLFFWIGGKILDANI